MHASNIHWNGRKQKKLGIPWEIKTWSGLYNLQTQYNVATQDTHDLHSSSAMSIQAVQPQASEVDPLPVSDTDNLTVEV